MKLSVLDSVAGVSSNVLTVLKQCYQNPVRTGTSIGTVL